MIRALGLFNFSRKSTTLRYTYLLLKDIAEDVCGR